MHSVTNARTSKGHSESQGRNNLRLTNSIYARFSCTASFECTVGVHDEDFSMPLNCTHPKSDALSNLHLICMVISNAFWLAALRYLSSCYRELYSLPCRRSGGYRGVLLWEQPYAALESIEGLSE